MAAGIVLAVKKDLGRNGTASRSLGAVILTTGEVPNRVKARKAVTREDLAPRGAAHVAIARAVIGAIDDGD